MDACGRCFASRSAIAARKSPPCPSPYPFGGVVRDSALKERIVEALTTKGAEASILFRVFVRPEPAVMPHLEINDLLQSHFALRREGDVSLGGPARRGATFTASGFPDCAGLIAIRVRPRPSPDDREPRSTQLAIDDFLD